MDKECYQNYLNVLNEELVVALGCTEPITIAYAAAVARSKLGAFPEKVELYCSGNIIKNANAVIVPNSGGLKGMKAAAILGVIGGDETKGLEVLKFITEEQQKKTRILLDEGYCDCYLAENVENLYVRVIVCKEKTHIEVLIQGKHNQIVEIKKNSEILYRLSETCDAEASGCADRSKMNWKDIFQFVDEVRIEDVRELLEQQINCNTALADEGLKETYGAQVGKTLLEEGGEGLDVYVKARTAAASDARMGGCSLPAVINSGSGNQGITASIPVIEYAKAWNVEQEKLYRALVLSNLLCIYQKHFIGNLSAFCGVVSAASSAGAGIMYLSGGSCQDIENTITNTLANASGMICDGAKSTCAAKIVTALSAAVLGYQMALKNCAFQKGEGIVQAEAEGTIQAVGYIGKIGMRQTDKEILNIILGKTKIGN